MSLNLIRIANFVDGMASVSLIQPDTFSGRLQKTLRWTGLVRHLARVDDGAAFHRVMRDRILGQLCYILIAFSLLGAAMWLMVHNYGDLKASMVALLVPVLTLGCNIASRRLNARVDALFGSGATQASW